MVKQISWSSVWLVAALLALAGGCNEHAPSSCTVHCTSDADCPGEQTCGELGLCTSGEACPCTAGEFLGCADDTTARFCNATANGVEMQSCGVPGCNADAGRCNLCVAGTATCNADSTALERCGDDGLVASTEACTLGCVAGDATVAPHCGHIAPLFVPDVCDSPATEPELIVPADTMIDTSTDATCNGGIVTQTMGPEICVIRYAKIDLRAGTVRVRGQRALALVADDALLVQGTLDVSADGATNGPGGGPYGSGLPAETASGGGGAGFLLGGANGGSAEVVGGRQNSGGSPLDPLAPSIRLIGGPAAVTKSSVTTLFPDGGGGGGAVTLVSCRGTVSVSGVIDAGGGGGQGGRDMNILAGSTNYAGGAGGGAGGAVMLQGIEVRVTGLVVANGGGGGGGCSTDNCSGNAGQDGPRSLVQAQGGAAKDQGGGGGAGGAQLGPGGGGPSYISPGGGGGSPGWLRALIPSGGSVTITSTSSPSFQANSPTLSTR
jgi:hypothetical protein